MKPTGFWAPKPQGADFSYFRLVLDTYRGLRRAGLSIDILPTDAPLDGYKLVVAPGLANHGRRLESAPRSARTAM